jgi:uncharacterized SAM-binding protein YcdF (DUF218 family)
VDLFLNGLKGQVNTLNIVLVLLASALVVKLFKRPRLAVMMLAFAFVIFVLTSTAYLPHYLVSRVESQYLPLDVAQYSSGAEEVLIHVLGGGYDYDERLPAHEQLSHISLGRLIEGLRISKQIENSKLIFSGWRVSGSESMALVMMRAAVSLGVDRGRIELLQDAKDTKEEVQHLVEKHGTDVNLILVTDAVHMPRAMKFYEEKGLKPHAAPTNYLVLQNENPYKFKWIPSADNILLMDRIVREFLGMLKGKFS